MQYGPQVDASDPDGLASNEECAASDREGRACILPFNVLMNALCLTTVGTCLHPPFNVCDQKIYEVPKFQ
jgi:hypothetical protein